MARRRFSALALACVCTCTLGLALQREADADPTTVEETYDPYEGMDRDGRIPKAKMPADLKHPSRWRYLPEGRIKPGNFFERFFVTSFIVPFFFRDSEAGTGGGIALTDVDFRKQRRREFAGLFFSYTTKRQQTYYGLWRRWLYTRDLPEGGVIQEDRSFVGLRGGYQKTLTKRFYGYGSGSRKQDKIRYTDELYELDLSFELAVPDPGSDWVVGGGVRAEFHNLSTSDDCVDFVGSTFEADCALGGWSRKDAFRDFIRDSDHEQLGYLTGSIRWDTRDSTRNPYEGWAFGLELQAPLLQDDSEVGVKYTFTGSKVFAVPAIFHSGGDAKEQNPPTDVLAFGAMVQLKTGDLPFTARPALGGSYTLRGYTDGRFRDNAAWHFSAEHRFWVIPRGFPLPWPGVRVERVGFAPFFDAGSVGADGAEFFSSEVKYSYGVGLRILLERGAPFRVDLGFSKDGFNWTARFGYTF